MGRERLKVVWACNQRVREKYPAAEDMDRLNAFADLAWVEYEGGSLYEVNRNHEDEARLGHNLGEADALVVCQGRLGWMPGSLIERRD